MEELNQFENLVIDALNGVDQSYYETTYRNIQNYRDAFQYRNGRYLVDNFARFGERVFCYEFYHQLRNLIDLHRVTNHLFLNGTLLQAEVEKMQIIELDQILGLHPLDGQYSPDFLMHSPGNANSHPFVMEVKCENDIYPRKIFNDLLKINQFITRYNYQRGIFIIINVNDDLIRNRIDTLQDRILRLEGRNNIKIISKENQNAQHFVWQL